MSDRSKSGSFSRRTLLRGAGVAMALPWLESIPVWGSSCLAAEAGADLAAGIAASGFPKRFAALFMACGINSTHWWAKGSGAEMELSKSLEPMAPYKAKMNFIDGLFNKKATGVGIHPGQTGNILSGAALQKGAELRRDHDGSGAGESFGGQYGAAEFGAGLRAAGDGVSRDEFFDGV